MDNDKIQELREFLRKEQKAIHKELEKADQIKEDVLDYYGDNPPEEDVLDYYGDNPPENYQEEDPQIAELKEIIARQQAILQEVMSPPLVAVTVVEVTDGKTAIIYYDGEFREITMVPELQEIVYPGLQVFMDEGSKTIIKLSTRPYNAGPSSTVERILEHGYAEVDIGGKISKVFNPINVEKGDTVCTNLDGTIITGRIPQDKNRFQINTMTSMTWDDIGGLREAKRDMIQAIEWPYMYPELYKKYGRSPVKGVLLWGPPGCGKTMIAKVTANRIAELHGAESMQTGYIYVKGPEILSPWVGKAEATIRQLFLQAKAHKLKYKYPAVIFVDEAESVLSKRGTGISSDMEKTIVPMFLSEMDGLEDSGAFVILATNRSDVLDPAVIRDGRIDIKVKIDRPDKEATMEIFMIHMKNVPRHPATVEDLCAYATDLIFSDDLALYKVKLKTRDEDGHNKCKLFRMANIVNGAMIHGAVQNAITNAISRDTKNGIVSGVTMKDLELGIRKVRKQIVGVREELKEFMQPFKDDVDKVEKL